VASITLSGGSIQQSFPVGTSVGAYPRAAKKGGGPPVGSAIVAQAVAADSTLPFSHAGLVLGGLYTAYALVGSQHRYVDFSIAQSDIAAKREAQTGIKIVEAAVDLISLATTVQGNTDVTLPAGSCKVGDGVQIVSGDDAILPYVIQAVKVIAADTVRIRGYNPHASTQNPAAANYLFAIFKTA
jgi:hypothetical protein